MSIAPVIRIRAKVPTWTPNERLRKVRRESELNQVDFATRIGVKVSTLSAWESGRNAIPDVLGLSETIESEFGYSKFWFRGDLDNEGYTPDPDPYAGEKITNVYLASRAVTDLQSVRERKVA